MKVLHFWTALSHTWPRLTFQPAFTTWLWSCSQWRRRGRTQADRSPNSRPSLTAFAVCHFSAYRVCGRSAQKALRAPCAAGNQPSWAARKAYFFKVSDTRKHTRHPQTAERRKDAQTARYSESNARSKRLKTNRSALACWSIQPPSRYREDLPGTCDGKRTEAMESALNWRSELAAIETKMLIFRHRWTVENRGDTAESVV